jgi:hypothetical protein
MLTMALQKVELSPLPLFLIIVGSIISTGAMRYGSYEFPLLSNFTPMGAFAIFGGAYFAQKWKAGLLSIVTLFVTDIFINYLYTSKLVWFHTSSLWLYASLIFMVMIGGLIKKVNVTNVLAASLASVAIHWLLTDIEPWIYSSYYDKGIIGYGESLMMALPFERNMLFADALFGAVLFGGYEFIKRKTEVIQPGKQLSV